MNNVDHVREEKVRDTVKDTKQPCWKDSMVPKMH